MGEFCQNYQQVIRKPEDAKIAALLDVKKRIAQNEVYYKCTCNKDFWIDNAASLCKDFQ